MHTIDNRQPPKYLQKKEERWWLFFNSDGLIITDNRGKIVMVNEPAELIFGYLPGEMINKKIEDLVPFTYRKRHIESREDYFKKSEMKIMGAAREIKGLKKNGTEFLVEIGLNSLHTSEGKFILATIHDITNGYSTEQRLMERENINRIIQYAPEAVVIMDENSIITEWNPMAEKLFGWEKKEVLGKPVSETIIPPEYREVHNLGLKLYLEKGEGKIIHKLVELPAMRKDGSIFQAGHQISVLDFRGKKFFIAFLSDITVRKKAEAELKKLSEDLANSNLELEQFANVASHDLQEPLRTVISYVQLLENRYKDKLDAEANEFIQFAVDGSMRMRNLIRSLLQYSRVNKNNPFENINTGNLLSIVLHDLKVIIEESKAQIKVENLPDIFGDPVLISQLFQNLLSNAIKFRGQKPPEIIVSGKSNNGELLFSVKDNGIGISPEYFNKLFTIFQRLHTNEQYPGTGIGLAVCKKIVEKHGGKIWVESEQGKGSTFYFTIKKQAQKDRNALSTLKD